MPLMLGLCLVLATSGLVAIAHAHGGDDTLIHACVNKSSGTIKIVDADQDCKKNEVALDWNAQGPAGPQGDPGPAGPAGPAGPGGVTGYQQLGAPGAALSPGSIGGYFTPECPPGKVAVSGGVTTQTGVATISSLRPFTVSRWFVRLRNPGATPVNVFLYTLCVDGA